MIKVQQYETNLRELIEENGYTFKEIAEETGISLSALFIYARGERSIPHESRCKIASVIGCPVTDIVSKKQPQREVRKKIVADDFLAELEDDLADRWNLYHTTGARYAYLGLSTKLQELDTLAQVVESVFAWLGLAGEPGKPGEHQLAHREKDKGLSRCTEALKLEANGDTFQRCVLRQCR